MPSPRPDLLLQIAITHALAKRDLPYTHPGILSAPRTRALALPGELLAAPMTIHPAEREQIEAILPDSIGPYQLGELYERAAGGRRSVGRFFTPPKVAEQMARACLRSFHAAHPPRACDPAMGTGNLLLALLQQAPPDQLDAWAANLYGVDRDPLAAQVARAAIGLMLIDAGFPARDLRQQLIAGDALLGACAPWLGQCDLVIANPPYIDSERMSREQPDWRRAISQQWASARGNWDLFVPFTELGLQLLNPTGRMAFLVPNRLLSAEYAATLRGLLANRIDAVIDHSQTGIFAAGVYPVVVVAGAPHQPGQTPHNQAEQINEPQRQVGTPTTSSSATAWVQLDRIAHLREAATVAEAYQLGAILEEWPEQEVPEGYLQVVNTGTIDRFRLWWGERPMRYLGKRYMRPVVPLAASRLSGARRWPLGQQAIVVAGLSRQIEAAALTTSTTLAAKTTILVIPDQIDQLGLLAYLNSAGVSRWYAAQYGGLALRGGYLRVGARQLARLPIPTEVVQQSSLLGQLVRAADWAKIEEVLQELPHPQ
ncbi:MAG: hypothetical protein OHK0050_27310 [Roseiflexaceae bacterium]